MDPSEIEQIRIKEQEKKDSLLEKQLKALLELVKASPTLMLKGEYRTNKKAKVVMSDILSVPEVPESFKLILSPNGVYALAPDGPQIASFSMLVPCTPSEPFKVGDVSFCCIVGRRYEPNRDTIKIIFDLHYPKKYEDSFLLVLFPQTMEQNDPESFVGRFEIQPEEGAPCLALKFNEI